MKYLITLSFVWMAFLSIALDKDKLYKEYPIAADHKSMCEYWLKEFAASKNENALNLAYYGAFQTIMANHLKNPFDKLETFKKGKANIEAAVQKDPSNIEIRFIRYSIQRKAPGFLNYNSKLSTDKKFLLEYKHKVESKTLLWLIDNIIKD